MADQTIEIKLVLRDELSKQLQPVIQGMRELQNARVDRAALGLDRLGGAARVVHREFSSLARLTLGGLIGGGVVAGIVSTAKALGDMARENLNLRYTAEGLGVAPEFLSQMTDGLHALGMSAEQAASSVSSAISTLREAEVQGSKSGLFSALEKGAHGSGIRLWNQIRQQMAGPEGAEGAYRFLITRMRDMNPSGQRALMKHLGLSSLAFKDLQEVLPQLNKRIQLSREESLKLSVANANFEISMGNVGRILGSAVMPGVEKVTTAFSKFLQTDNGKKFANELREWSDSVGTAIAGWISDTGPDGLSANIEALKVSVSELKEYFTAADNVIKAMGLTWPGVMKGLVATGFALWLVSVAAQLALIARIPGIITLLSALGAAAWFLNKNMADQIQDPEERRKAQESGAPQSWGEFFWQFFNDLKNGNIDLLGEGAATPKPQSGEGQPRTEQERRADLARDKSERDALTRELRDATYAMAKFNDYTAPGGPEGSADGRSGYGAGTMALPALPGGYPIRPGQASASVSSWLARQLSGITSGTGRGSWFGNFRGLNDWIDKGDKPGSNRLGVYELRQGIALPSGSTLGKWHMVTGPDGRQFKVQQTDIGPHKTTGRSVDVSAAAAEGMGYTPKTFPTDAQFGMQPMSLNLGDIGGLRRARGRESIFYSGIAPPRQPWSRHGGSGMDAAGFSGITSTLAREGGGGSINGSATVDIDVSGLGGGEGRPDLFKPSPLGGAVQMQNAQHVPNNPLSFQ